MMRLLKVLSYALLVLFIVVAILLGWQALVLQKPLLFVYIVYAIGLAIFFGFLGKNISEPINGYADDCKECKNKKNH